jgi:hypothetical protein
MQLVDEYQAYNSQDDYDYLDIVHYDTDFALSNHSQLPVQQEEFDVYVNQTSGYMLLEGIYLTDIHVVTSSPSPPQRAISGHRLHKVPGRQYTHSGLSSDDYHQRSPTIASYSHSSEELLTSTGLPGKLVSE